ncbi:MAG TPA: hypothetical protein HPQ00_08035 [Magnetococcales bacterium]|nr:hypothetical protein [Magnetococcales bacterium]
MSQAKGGLNFEAQPFLWNSVCLGLKIWTSNKPLISEVRRLYDSEIIRYVELYIVPGTEKEYGYDWQIHGVPKVLHAPHFGAGFNLSLKEKESSNRRMWNEVMRYADRFDPEGLIVHLGTSGNLSESVRQLGAFATPPCPLWIENKPCLSTDGSRCVGVTPDDILEAKSLLGSGFCLDFSHALCYSAYAQLDHHRVLENFLELNPQIYHLCDGFMGSIRDQHLHLGEGDYNLPSLVNLLPDNAMVSLETPKKSQEDLFFFESECLMILEMRKSNP